VFNFDILTQEGEELPQRLDAPIVQKRKAYRAAVAFPVCYELAGRVGLRAAAAVDLSVGGLRMLVDEDFVPDVDVTFHFTLPTAPVEDIPVERVISSGSTLRRPPVRITAPPAPFRPMQIRAALVVSFYHLRAKTLAHGVRFVDLPTRERDESQRFIHLYQLKQLRRRAERYEVE
jgi:c-di-GMP-binding flagellar brake protein YcgR